MNVQDFLNSITSLIEDIESKEHPWDFMPAIQLFQQFLKDNPENIEVRTKYALFIYDDVHDEMEGIKQLHIILKYDCNNIFAKFLLGYIAYFSIGVVDDLTNDIICDMEIKDNNKELLSIRELIKSWYYYSDKEKEKECLLKSIEYWDKHVWNYRQVGLYYYFKKDYRSAYYYFEKAFSNIQLVYTNYDNRELFSPELFINEQLKGIYVSHFCFEGLQSLMQECALKSCKADPMVTN